MVTMQHFFYLFIVQKNNKENGKCDLRALTFYSTDMYTQEPTPCRFTASAHAYITSCLP